MTSIHIKHDVLHILLSISEMINLQINTTLAIMHKITVALSLEEILIYIMAVTFMCLMFLKLKEEMSHCEQAEYNVQEIITPVTSCPIRSLCVAGQRKSGTISIYLREVTD